MGGNNVRFSAFMDDHVTSTLGKIEDKFKTAGKSEGFKAIAQGVGIGAGISAFGLLGSAVSGVTGFLGESVKAYQEEQDSVSRLGASLKANVADWDGNTSAIEKTLSARMRLGFSDEDQRNSLALLVGATHDVNKALEIESTAMDLARFKRISLADASEALTKVEAGSFRVLKSLGIVLKDGATQQDALNAVQAVAMGQAEEYANSDLGKVEISQIKVNEAQEKWGKGLSKLQAEILPAAADAVTSLTYALDRTSIPLEKLEEAAGKGTYGAIAQFNHLQEAAQELGVSVEEAYRLMGEAGSQNVADIKYWQMVQSDKMDHAERSINKVSAATTNAADTTKTAVAKLNAAYATWAGKATIELDKIYLHEKHVVDELDKLAHNALSQYFDPIITADKLAADEAEIAANKKIIASKKSTAAEIRDARARNHELAKSVTEERIQLFEAGKLSRSEQGQLLKDLRYDWAHSTGAAKAYIASLIAEITRLQNSSGVRITVGSYGESKGRTSHQRAGGGFLPPGESSDVGELGVEGIYANPGGGVTVTSRSTRRTGGRSGGGDIHLHISSVWPATRAQIKAIYDELAHYEYTQPVSGSGNRF